MAYGDALKNYQRTNVETSDPLQLVILCYDAAIKDLKAAKQFHKNQAMQATYDKISHAQDVITELLVALDYERGGEIARNLSRLYNFMLRQLIGLHIKKNTVMYDHLIYLLSDLKEAWEQIREKGAPVPSVPEHTNRTWSGISA